MPKKSKTYKQKVVLFSIHPEYVGLIFKKTKRYEFRKSCPTGNKAVIYSTSPVKKIVGSFTMGKILIGPPKNLWDVCKNYAGISSVDFFKYYEGKTEGYAITILDPCKFAFPLDPYKILDNFHAPQAWMYFDSTRLWGNIKPLRRLT